MQGINDSAFSWVIDFFVGQALLIDAYALIYFTYLGFVCLKEHSVLWPEPSRADVLEACEIITVMILKIDPLNEWVIPSFVKNK